MSALPIATVYKPSTLQGVTNGKLDASLLREVGPSGRLHYIAARAFLALVAAAARAGIPLTYTYGGTYRTYQQQVDLFLRRYVDHYDPKITTTSYKWWNGKRWYKRIGVAAAATPGTSNHGWGLAIDTALDREPEDGLDPADAVSITPALTWMINNAPRFGFSWELQSEPWHIRYCHGDTLPEAVLQEEGLGAPQPVEADPKPSGFDPAEYDFGLYPYNTGKPVIREGSKGDFVKYLQGVLRKLHAEGGLLSDCGSIDGIFGRRTDAAVRELQAANGLVVDGYVGSKTWPVVDWAATH